MSVHAVVYNKEGDWFEWDRACFGFLSYIDCWDGSEVEGTNLDADDLYDMNDGIDGFDSKNLSHIVYKESVSPELRDTLQKAMAGLPQYYGDVTVTTDPSSRWSFEIPIQDKPMASTVIGCMMLRNIVNYAGYRNSYVHMVEKGVEPSVAFILAQAFQYRHDALKSENRGWYRYTGGDDNIFGSNARLCDLVAAIKGEIGDDWQGDFGETDNGYGRYSEYNQTAAPKNERTGNNYDLSDVTLIKKDWEKSPKLNKAEELGGILEGPYKAAFWPIDNFIGNFIPLLKGETE